MKMKHFYHLKDLYLELLFTDMAATEEKQFGKKYEQLGFELIKSFKCFRHSRGTIDYIKEQVRLSSGDMQNLNYTPNIKLPLFILV